MATETRSDLPASRAEAKRLGYKHYFTGKPCKHGHVDVRYAVDGCCYICNYYANRKSYVKNREKCNASCRVWKRNNPGYLKAWRKANPGKNRSYVRARQAAQRNAVPAWITPADRAKMEQFYRVADGLGRRYNEPHEVDHVVPLQSDRVCGLHCPANLQVLPAAQNASKGNRWDPDVGTAKT